MKAIAQTSRLIFREINEDDENDLYARFCLFL